MAAWLSRYGILPGKLKWSYWGNNHPLVQDFGLMVQGFQPSFWWCRISQPSTVAMTLGTVPGLKDDITPSLGGKLPPFLRRKSAVHPAWGGRHMWITWPMNRPWPIYGIDDICDIPICNIPGGWWLVGLMDGIYGIDVLWYLIGGDWNHGMDYDVPCSVGNECHHPNWRTHSMIFQRGRWFKPPARYCMILLSHYYPIIIHIKPY